MNADYYLQAQTSPHYRRQNDITDATTTQQAKQPPVPIDEASTVSLDRVTVSNMHATETTTRRRRGSRWAVLAAAAITAACGHLGVSHAGPAASPPATGTLASLLAQVRIVDQINPIPGYDRGCGKGHGCVFGPAWNDPLDHTGCDTRNRLLHKALQDIEKKRLVR